MEDSLGIFSGFASPMPDWGKGIWHLSDQSDDSLEGYDIRIQLLSTQTPTESRPLDGILQSD